MNNLKTCYKRIDKKMSLNQKSTELYSINDTNSLFRTIIPQSQSLTHNMNSNGLNSCFSTSSQWSQCSSSALNGDQFQNFCLTSKDIIAFKRLLDEPIVDDLLNWDTCCLLADKYLLATALTYFKRANLRHQQYTPCYLFVALYLAHDMEEDDLDLKNDLVRFAMCNSVSNSMLKLFLRKRDKLWHAMGLRTAVNHLCCEAIMRYCLPHHKIWRRERDPNHGGVALPMHVKNVVHKELHLMNSYIECNIRCIICESRHFMYFQKCSNPSIAIVSTLSADSVPFVPKHNYHLPVKQYICNETGEE